MCLPPRFFACPLGEVAGRVRHTLHASAIRCEKGCNICNAARCLDFVFAELILGDILDFAQVLF